MSTANAVHLAEAAVFGAGPGHRHITVNLTPWVGDEAASVWFTAWSATPVQALRRVLERLDRGPHQLQAKRTWRGDTVLLDHRPGQPANPLAFVMADLSLDDVKAALAAIARGDLK